MFTGIVEAVGTLRGMWGDTLLVDLPPSARDWKLELGESMALNGVCLTLRAFDDGLRFDVSGETLARTALGSMVDGARVNLERAMPANGRFGGHIVQGHVDSTCEVVSVLDADSSRVFRFEASFADDRYLIDKGSVAIDGVSLTVVRPESGVFDVWVIPHTLESTNLGDRRPGDRVNLEFDVIAKYVERLLDRD